MQTCGSAGSNKIIRCVPTGEWLQQLAHLTATALTGWLESRTSGTPTADQAVAQHSSHSIIAGRFIHRILLRGTDCFDQVADSVGMQRAQSLVRVRAIHVE